MPARLLLVLQQRERARHRAAPTGDAKTDADEEIAHYNRLRALGAVNHGVVTITTASTSVPVHLNAGAVRIVDRLVLTAGGSNAGTVYVGGPLVTSANGTPLIKTSPPIELARVLLAEVCVLGTSAGDVVAWIAGAGVDVEHLED